MRWCLVLVLALPLACPGNDPPEPRRACLIVVASPDLNLFDDQAHSITLYLYPLTSPLGFEQSSVSDLLDGQNPPGLAGPRVPITVAPGERRTVEAAFPQGAISTGVLADYYRAPGDPEGTRRGVVPARCGSGSPKLTLSAHDLLVN